MDYAANPRARFDYEILETVEAGLILEGFEVKAIRTGKASIKGAYVRIVNNIPLLVGATISPYQPSNTPITYDPGRDRGLLLTKSQIATLVGVATTHGLTLVPLAITARNGTLKLVIGVARGKKTHDKRSAIKKKDIARAHQRGIED